MTLNPLLNISSKPRHVVQACVSTTTYTDIASEWWHIHEVKCYIHIAFMSSLV